MVILPIKRPGHAQPIKRPPKPHENETKQQLKRKTGD